MQIPVFSREGDFGVGVAGDVEDTGGELLAPFGLDAKDPGFWAIGLSVIERMIDELETMA